MSNSPDVAAITGGGDNSITIPQQQQNQHHVECATYPIPQGLAQHIQAAVASNRVVGENTTPPDVKVEMESIHDALGEIVGNAIVALDTLYFSQPPSVRQHNTFQHRLCLRVCANTTAQTLTITDLGIGMTRSDLINCLGIGRSSNIPTLLKVTPASTDNDNNNNTREQNQPDTATTEDEEQTDDTSVDDDDDDDDDDSDDDDDDEDEDEDQNINNGVNRTNKMDDTGSSAPTNATGSTASVEEDDNDDDDDEYFQNEIHTIDENIRQEQSHHESETVDLDHAFEKPSLTHVSSRIDLDHALDDETVTTNKIIAPVSTPAPTAAESTTTSKKGSSKNKKKSGCSCKASSIGGFYAAFCSLGVSITVGTKSKFDDYYEFRIVPKIIDSPDRTVVYESFEIRRPYPEGTTLSVANGQTLFEQVRGESGTAICIQLNPVAIQAGLLSEQDVLKPMFLKIVETTQYTVAFSTDIEQATAIIDASAIEEAYRLDRQKRQDADGDAGNDRMEVSSLDDDIGDDIEMEDANTHNYKPGRNKASEGADLNSVKERAKYIPVRLSLGERKMLRLVEATMNCCDYTTQVDQDFSTSTKKKGRRLHEQLRGVTAILHGLVTACDYSAGQKLVEENNYSDYTQFFQQMFEIARRHKIMNPEKMRTEYGKLIYILQDAVSPAVQQQLGFSVKQPILSVYRFLEHRNGLAVLSDPLIERATEEILAGPGRTRAKIDQDIRLKERAVQHIKKKYKSNTLTSDDIHLCLYSICDNNSFLNSNRVPIDKVIDYLKTHFSPSTIEEGYSLSIVSGTDGARLSHSHERQYYFALQSLTLWRTIINDMFRLWAMAEDDLLNNDVVVYSLQNTGQGMQRVQQSPRTYKAMQQILIRVQNQVQNWVGSSVIHMGDHNVPNALSFIDKYTQVPRILGPIVTCLEMVEQLCSQDDGIKNMITTGFGGLEKLRKDILYDFFRSAFDGSGADNFYDAGSCIDGRLTSAWNWCSQLPDKPFYPIFKLTGFIGFDGEFQ